MGEKRGGGKNQQGRLEKSDELVLGWKFQTGEKKEREPKKERERPGERKTETERDRGRE